MKTCFLSSVCPMGTVKPTFRRFRFTQLENTSNDFVVLSWEIYEDTDFRCVDKDGQRMRGVAVCATNIIRIQIDLLVGCRLIMKNIKQNS